ncbi:MAG: alpha/beta fold hydrolase, partial [Patescibacteria group bacterium]
MKKSAKVLNKQNEKLDVLIEGSEKSPVVVVFSHGLGAGKGETYSYFSDIAKTISSEYITVRFDYSGYGQSEGEEVDVTYYKQRDDLSSILDYVSKNFSNKDIYIIAHSMGTFITLLLNDNRVKKAALTGIPNTNTEYIVKKVAERIRSRDGSH